MAGVETTNSMRYVCNERCESQSVRTDPMVATQQRTKIKTLPTPCSTPESVGTILFDDEVSRRLVRRTYATHQWT